MSVLPPSREEAEGLLKRLRSLVRQTGIFFPYEVWSQEEKYRREVLGMRNDRMEAEDSIEEMVRRVYLARQMAYHDSYDKTEVWSLEVPKSFPAIGAGVLGRAELKTLYEDLRSARYNVFSQRGSCFLQESEMERLGRMMELCLKLIAGVE